MGPLMRDEINIFERTIGFQSLGDNSVTLKQDAVVAPNGPLPGVRFMIFLRQRRDLTSTTFREGVRVLPTSFADADQVCKLRLHLLEPYDDTSVFLNAGAQTVSHGLAAQDQYQAVLEIAFHDAGAQAEFHAGAIWKKAGDQQRELCSAVHPFRITRTYTPKLAGRLTLSGLRGAAVVDQIRALCAVNQVGPETLSLFYGSGDVVEMQL